MLTRCWAPLLPAPFSGLRRSPPERRCGPGTGGRPVRTSTARCRDRPRGYGRCRAARPRARTSPAGRSHAPAATLRRPGARPLWQANPCPSARSLGEIDLEGNCGRHADVSVRKESPMTTMAPKDVPLANLDGVVQETLAYFEGPGRATNA